MTPIKSFKASPLLFLLGIVLVSLSILLCISCKSVKPVSTIEYYTFDQSTVGIPPYKLHWKRIHQPEDPDWRWNMPWDQHTYDRENIEFVKNGVKIWARNGKYGCLYSNFHFKYGKVSAKIRLPKEEGAWSAFWLFGGLPEFDILEHCGGETYVNVTHHWGYNYDHSNFKTQTTHNKRRGIDPYDWNIYAVEVTPYKIIYSINGKVVRKKRKGISSDERHILLTCVWGQYCGGKTPDAFMEVEWLRLERY